MAEHSHDTVYSIDTTWHGLIADLSLQYGDLHIDAKTVSKAPVIKVSDGWVQVVGTSSVGSFNLYLPAAVCLSILEASASDLDVAELNGTDAALVFEHVTSQRLEQLEQVLGCDLAISKITDVTRPVQERLFGLDVDVAGETYPVALSVTGKLHEWFEVVVHQYSNLEERQLNERMIVHLGPVVVPSRQAYLARINEMIDCGVMPSDVIKGVLMREDGYYWPIFIEDDAVEIAGPLAGPVAFPENDSDRIYVTFGIGDVKLDAVSRLNLSQGSRVNIQRFPENSANIYYQAKPFGKGHLAIRGENLAVSVDHIGSFQE